MINHKRDVLPGNGHVPPFTAIRHPSIPRWVLEGLDRMFALEPGITKLHFDLWPISYHDDNSNLELKGTVVINAIPGVTEERLDEVPPVRMFERRADELWEYVPLFVDDHENASIRGEYDFHAERGRVVFEYRTTDDLELTMGFEIIHDGKRWVADDRIIIANHEGSASDLLAADGNRVLAAYSENDLLLREIPEVTGVEMDDEERVVFHLKQGELTRCMEKR